MRAAEGKNILSKFSENSRRKDHKKAVQIGVDEFVSKKRNAKGFFASTAKSARASSLQKKII